LWAEMLNTSVFLTNISSISTELFSELLTDEQKAQTPYETWHGISYAMSKTLVIIEAEDYIHIVDDKKVKSKKLIARSKKMTVHAVKLVKIQDDLLLSQNNKSQSLILALLAKLDDDLFNNDDI